MALAREWASRAIRRAAFLGCKTPFEAAFPSVRVAARSASLALIGSFAAIASRARFTADRTAVLTDAFRSRRFCA